MCSVTSVSVGVCTVIHNAIWQCINSNSYIARDSLRIGEREREESILYNVYNETGRQTQPVHCSKEPVPSRCPDHGSSFFLRTHFLFEFSSSFCVGRCAWAGGWLDLVHTIAILIVFCRVLVRLVRVSVNVLWSSHIYTKKTYFQRENAVHEMALIAMFI